MKAFKDMYMAERAKVEQMEDKLKEVQKILQTFRNASEINVETLSTAKHSRKRGRRQTTCPQVVVHVGQHPDLLLAKRQRQPAQRHQERAYPGPAAGSKRPTESLDEERQHKAQCTRPAAAAALARGTRKQQSRRTTRKSRRK